MATTYRTTRRVEFRDTDAAGLMHFSTYFTYMEQVEHEWLRELGLSVVSWDETGKISWPRVAASCEYHRGARFEQRLEIEAHIERLGEKSITYGFQFSADGSCLARGTMTSVCCRIETDAPPRAIPIPSPFLDKLRPLAGAAEDPAVD